MYNAQWWINTDNGEPKSLIIPAFPEKIAGQLTVRQTLSHTCHELQSFKSFPNNDYNVSDSFV